MVQFTDETDCLGLPVDTRTRAEKLGDMTGGDKQNIPVKSAVSSRKELSAAERASRAQARKLALDYSNQMILNLVELALTGKIEASRIEASKQVLYIGLGRPAPTHIDLHTAPTIPNFTIVFNDGSSSMTIASTDYTVQPDHRDIESDQRDAESEQ